jgi:hypothetical protein
VIDTCLGLVVIDGGEPLHTCTLAAHGGGAVAAAAAVGAQRGAPSRNDWKFAEHLLESNDPGARLDGVALLGGLAAGAQQEAMSQAGQGTSLEQQRQQQQLQKTLDGAFIQLAALLSTDTHPAVRLAALGELSGACGKCQVLLPQTRRAPACSLTHIRAVGHDHVSA